MCRKGPTFSHRPSDVYLIRLGMEWSPVFPILSAFEGPQKASLDHQPALGKTCSEVARGSLPLVPFQAASTPSQLMMQNEKLFRFWGEGTNMACTKCFMLWELNGLGPLSKPFISWSLLNDLDEHMPPLSQDRGTINEEDAPWNCEGGFVIASLMQLFSYVETEYRQSITVFSFLLFLPASPLREAYLSAPNQLCYKWSCSFSETDCPVFFVFFLLTFFPSTGCLEEKIDKFHFSFMLLCPGWYSGRWKQHHQVCWSTDGTQPSGSIVD